MSFFFPCSLCVRYSLPFLCCVRTCVTSSATFRASTGASTACALAATPLAGDPFLGASLPLLLLAEAEALARTAVRATGDSDGEGDLREDGSGKGETERDDTEDMALAAMASMVGGDKEVLVSGKVGAVTGSTVESSDVRLRLSSSYLTKCSPVVLCCCAPGLEGRPGTDHSC